jgi:integral membrane protein
MTFSRALWFYRVMAYVVGCMLIAVFVFIHVGHWSIVGYRSSTKVESVIGPIHGALYVVYLLAALLLVIQARLPWWTWLVMATGGWLPFAAFVVERWVSRPITHHVS